MKRTVIFNRFGLLVEKTAAEKEIPLSRLAHYCNISYATLRRGLESPKGPKPLVVWTLCDKLGIDHIEAHELLGWIPENACEKRKAH